jgi:tetratricopeptide (TPR) repeat protein
MSDASSGAGPASLAPSSASTAQGAVATPPGAAPARSTPLGAVPAAPDTTAGPAVAAAAAPVAGGPAAPLPQGPRGADARMARLHLRGGMLGLARAALEQMAGAGTLDTEALVDLAEVRWRSGDLEGAAEAARAHLALGGREPMADVIVAESLQRSGRQGEAFRHADAVEQRVGHAVDVLFAGERRGPAWPPDDGSIDRAAVLAGRFGLLVGGREVAAPTPRTWAVDAAPSRRPERGQDQRSERGQSRVAAAAAPGGTTIPSADVPVPSQAGGRPPAGHGTSGPAQELEVSEHLLSQGRYAEAAERLAVILRLEPRLAPVILSLAGRAVASGGPSPEGLSALHVVRGDAYRGLGREVEAQAAYQQALRALAARPARKEQQP